MSKMDKSSSTKVAHQERNILENIYEIFFLTRMSWDSDRSDDGGAAGNYNVDMTQLGR